jgi:hypothetical protein
MDRSKYNLRTKDVAHILDCSPDDVGVAAKKEKLKGIRNGKYWFFRLQDVEVYMKKREREGEG